MSAHGRLPALVRTGEHMVQCMEITVGPNETDILGIQDDEKADPHRSRSKFGNVRDFAGTGIS
jgi:hypothetical protein